MNYLVKIDEQGKLRWARNNTLVDTTAGRWKDAGGGAGIVPLDVPERPPLNGGRGSFSSSLSSSSVSSDEAITHYVGEVKGSNRFTRSIRRKFTPSGWVQKLLRKTVARNTWVYVADAQCVTYSSGSRVRLSVSGMFRLLKLL
ncbi:uncharacterized protein SCHCODRAFT_01166699 [Schizophyllum commune H4-8]|uniref:uncharacterized protein n=1 Tax=Schizophyllum commune (strain H4-8 / FGSC 9210) TaxID=578458 RepID=UPI00215F9910|nr:uncharacterized protein SCHCODRAFT_01166699 [Schizophyllum commune H4-8]KAI5898454.1 hypothetical protein SCHCODRAFT_01166699 [Schizophyllum commune H4-8]